MGHPAAYTRRGFLRATLYAAGAVIAGAAAGCAAGEGGGGDARGRVTLTQWYHQYGEQGTEAAVHRYARRYTQAHPGVAIRVVWVPGDYSTKLSTALLTPEGPDVFEGQVTQAAVQAGQLAVLDDLYTPAERADFFPADIAMCSVGGKLYGVKELDDIGLLYYRRDALARAGVAPPATFAELRQAARALTRGARKGLFLGNDGGISSLLSVLLWSAGEEFLAGDRVAFATPRAARVYEALRDLNNDGSLLIGAPVDYYDPSALVQNLCAMQWSGLWAYPAIVKALGADAVGAVAWPAFDAQPLSRPATFLSGWTAMVNAQSPPERVAAAKRYVRSLWIDDGAVQRDWSLSYGFHIPSRRSVAATAAPLRAGVPQVAVQASSRYARFLPPIWNNAMTLAMTDAVTNIVKLGAGADSEIAIAGRKCAQEIERALE